MNARINKDEKQVENELECCDESESESVEGLIVKALS